MKIIDIYNNGDYRSIADDMLAARLEWIGASIPVAAIRRSGPVADIIARSGNIDLLTSGFGLGSRFSMPYKVQRLSRHIAPIILHTHSFELAEQAGLIARSYESNRRPKIVFELHSVEERADGNRIRFAIDEADLLLFHTEADRDTFFKYYKVDSGKRTQVIAPSVSSVRNESIHAAPSNLTLLWGGRVTAGSGITELIDTMGALASESTIRLIIAGQGKPAEAVPVIRRVKQLGISSDVEFLGDMAITPALMEEVSAMIVTSGNDPFASWNVAMAKSVGLPMIMASSTRNREMMPPGGGIFYTPQSDGSDSLREALNIVGSGRSMLDTMSAAMKESNVDNSGSTDLINMYYSLAAL